MFEFLEPETLKAFLAEAGLWAPLLFIVLQALQVIAAPIPMQVFGLAGGYAFGALPGTIYSLTGLVIGTFVVVWLVKRYGRPLVERFVKPHTLERFDSLSRSSGQTILFLIFLFPGLPDDAICFIAGLSPLSIRTIVVLAFLGRLPGVAALSIVGEQLASGKDLTVSIIIISAVVLIVGLFYIYRGRMLRRFMPRGHEGQSE